MVQNGNMVRMPGCIYVCVCVSWCSHQIQTILVAPAAPAASSEDAFTAFRTRSPRAPRARICTCIHIGSHRYEAQVYGGGYSSMHTEAVHPNIGLLQNMDCYVRWNHREVHTVPHDARKYRFVHLGTSEAFTTHSDVRISWVGRDRPCRVAQSQDAKVQDRVPQHDETMS